MLVSKALLLITTILAVFSFYALFYSIYQIQLKFEDTSDTNLLSQGNSTTWFKPKTKVVFVIVDGLRFDNLLNYKSIEHDSALDGNKFHQFNRAYSLNPDRFAVFRAYADLPTMTILRVPCMMTGNVPRLGSVLTAFGALPATEDSIPRQLYLQNKKSYFAGDPVLPQYFPKYLTSDYTIGAFNMRDRFVDDPSHSFMNKKLKENDFDFLGGHFLEVDHAGHHTGLATPLMRQSIANMDKYLMQIMNKIDDDTMLLFAGDHGLTREGSHGGGSRAETDTAIVAYHKRGFMKNKYKSSNLKKIMRSVSETDEQVVNQIDIVPTLSMLMGLPTPFSNMGQIINDLYPVGNYLPKQKCPKTTTFDAGFLMQMLNDNHLNTLQVWNYFKKYHEGQSLFSDLEYLPVADLFQKVEADYKAADQLIKENLQCDQKFHDATLTAIQKSQQLARQVHDLVSFKPPHDLVIFWQAFLLLVLVGISYILQVQYLYKTKDYEHMTWSFKTITKRLVPFAIPLGLVWIYMLAKGDIIMRPITSTALAVAVWIFGASVLSFLSLPQEQVPQPIPSSPTVEDEENSPALPSKPKSSMRLPNPLVFAGALSIFASLFYLTREERLVAMNQIFLPESVACICVLVVAARICGKYPKFFPYIAGVAIFLGIGIQTYKLWNPKREMLTALVFVGDWLFCEMQFAKKKLKGGNMWSYHYIIGFIVLVLYHHVLPVGDDFTQIYLPRVLWGIIIISIVASFTFRMPRRVIKRNLQVNLILFLTLMQVHKKFIYFGITLSIMRIFTFIFKRTSFKNYLYPLFLGFFSYIGFWAIGYDDLKLPRRFGPAFVGLRDFHLGSCLLLFSSSFLSTIILGMLFISFYSQDLDAEDTQLGIQSEETSVKSVALSSHSSVVRKRNFILYCFFYNMLMIGAAVNPVVLKKPLAIFTAMETFLVDGAFYLFTVNVMYFAF